MHTSAVMEEQQTLQLKYCECCGKFWLRPVGSQETRCGACICKWADFPTN